MAEEEAVYDPSMPMGTDAGDLVVVDVSRLGAGEGASGTGTPVEYAGITAASAGEAGDAASTGAATPSMPIPAPENASNFSEPLALPGLHSTALASSALATSDPSLGLSAQTALEEIGRMDDLEVDLAANAADHAGAAAAAGNGDAGGKMVEKVQEGEQVEEMIERQVENEPMPPAGEAAPAQGGAGAPVDANADAEGQIDQEMDVDGASQSGQEEGAPANTSAPIDIDGNDSVDPSLAVARPRSPSPPPVTRRPGHMQRRSPVYESNPAASSAPSAPPPFLPPRPVDVLAGSAYSATAPGGGRSPSISGSVGGAGGERGHQRSFSGSVGGNASFNGPGTNGSSKVERDWDKVEWIEGLSRESASVKRFPGAVEMWLDFDKSPETTLALFQASCTASLLPDARAYYAYLSKLRPTATEPLSRMIELEMEHSNFPAVVALFEKALRGLGGSVGAVPGVPIWRAYLHYIRRQNPIPPVHPGPDHAARQAAADAVRETVKAAYELALRECGTDIASGPVWSEYIAFLGERMSEGGTSWEVQQNQDALRRTYQRAVSVPVDGLEVVWRKYDAFENRLNKVTAKKFLAERSPFYMTARKVLRDLKAHMDAVAPTSPLPAQPNWSEADRALAINWKKYLKWEESNPLEIEDASVLQSRVMYAMKKCLTWMRYYPELWFHAVTYLQSIGKVDEAGAYLGTGVEANPQSFLLTFACAEHEEAKKNNAAAHKSYESLIAKHGSAIDDCKASIEKEVLAAMGPEPEIEEGVDPDIEMVGAGPSEASRRRSEREARGEAARERRAKELSELYAGAGVIWVMYMRFVRRAEGMKAARVLFSNARKSPYMAWQVYEAAASMEYVCNNQANIATKIYELGLKAFPDEIAIAKQFLEFQLQINDEANARALFERLVLKFPPEKARPIWDVWAKHEYAYGDLAACIKMESRLAEAYPQDSALKRFASRYVYQGIDQILVRDLGLGNRSTAPPAAPAPPTPSQAIKRSAPEDSPRRSPRIPEPRYRDDRRDDRMQMPPARDNGPMKRQRPSSPPPRDRDRRGGPPPDNRWGPPREPSPPPRRPMPPPGPAVSAESPHRSGLPQSVVWFLGNLPSARTFDGPLFRPDDLLNVLANVSVQGGGGGRPIDVGYRGPPRR